MKRKVLLGCLGVALVALVGGTLFAGSDGFRFQPNAGEGRSVYTDDLIEYAVTHDGLQDATGMVVTTNDEAGAVRGRVADLFLAGDLWRLALVGRRNVAGSNQDFFIDATSNNCAGDPEFEIVVCDPDVYGPYAQIFPAGRVGRVQALAIVTFGNDAPAGIPATGGVQLETNGLFQAEIGPFTF